MGYTTDFYGEFDILPALKKEHREYLLAFASVRHMTRDPLITITLPDPVRMATGLPVGPDGAYFVGSVGKNFGQDHTPDVIADEPGGGMPGYWCQWIPDEDGTHLKWDEGEKFYEYDDWLEYLIVNFLNPWGYLLCGIVEWQGESSDDRGRLVIASADNNITVQSAFVTWQ